MRFRDKLQIELISFLCVAAGFTACQEYDETGRMPRQEGKPVTVSLQLGLSDETDAYTLTPVPSASTKSETADKSNAPFVAELAEQKTTKTADLKPDGLYELHIIQYTAGGDLIGSVQYRQGKTDLGSHLDIQLQASDDCQLVIIVCGKDNTTPSIGGNMTNLQSLIIPQTVFDAIPTNNPTQEQINKMPYVLHLPKVKITADPNNASNGIIQSPDGVVDTRLMLKRLAVKLKVTWNINPALTTNGYTLKEVKLCQVPKDFRILPTREQSQWGTTYPVAVAEFIDKYRLSGNQLTGVTSKEVWMPANVRGSSPKASSPIYRNKENAPLAASYMEFVIDNASKNERLYYRAYLGGKDISDFNLYENTDYEWTASINSANYQADPRIQLLDQTPVISTNEVRTANCFMVPPGGNICFNPYKHTSGTNGWNDQLVSTPESNPTIKTPIDHVKIVWQTKDNATTGDLVLGYTIDKNNHTNTVNVTNPANISQALIHTKTPLTKGGTAIIAACDANDVILWSWTLWITNYVPVPIKNKSEYAAAQQASKNGTVHQYANSIFQTGEYQHKVMMDRNLCASAGGFPGKDASIIEFAKRTGYLYPWGRKDPFFSTVDGTNREIDVIYDGDGYSLTMPRQAYSSIDKPNGNTLLFTIQHPDTYITGVQSWYNGSFNQDYAFLWNKNNNGSKSIYDPCPEGWKIPHKDVYANINKNNALWFNGTSFIQGNGSNFGQGGRLYNLSGSNGLPQTVTEHNTCWLPLTAFRATNGNLASSNSYGYLSAYQLVSGKNYYIKYGTVEITLTNSSGNPNEPCSTRCVQE